MDRPEPTPRTVRLVAVGDLMLGDSAICTGYGFASRYSEEEFAGTMSATSALLGSADIVFGNLECSLSQHGHEPRKWTSTQLRGREGYASALRVAGFNIVNVANNHASQHGDQVFFETVALMRAAGVACCGLRGSGPWCSEPAFVEANDLRIGFLGYCLRPRQYSPALPPFAEGSSAEIAEDIDRLKPDVDHVVVSLHWGEEYVSVPSVSEVDLAHDIIDAGAAVILGHHPHVPRPIERWRGGVIAYSLSNFISDMIWYSPLREPLLLTLDLADCPVQVTATRLHIADSYLPVSLDPPCHLQSVDNVTGLSERAYRREVDRTLREGRMAAYRYAAANARNFRSPTLRQLLGITVRNKVKALGDVVRRRGNTK